MEDLDEYLNTLLPFFSEIRNKTVLEYACFVGDWWKMFERHSPKKVISFDPYPRVLPDLRRNLEKYKHMVEFYNVGYEDYSIDSYDVVVCAGLMYKLSSPFHLIENIVNRNPSIVFFETTGQIGQGSEISIIKHSKENNIDLNRNKTVNRLPWHIVVPPDVVVSAFDELGYSLDDYINIKNNVRPAKRKVAMMRFKRK